MAAFKGQEKLDAFQSASWCTVDLRAASALQVCVVAMAVIGPRIALILLKVRY